MILICIRLTELQGIEVLNVDQLANAMKPAVLPGECLQVPNPAGRGNPRGRGLPI